MRVYSTDGATVVFHIFLTLAKFASSEVNNFEIPIRAGGWRAEVGEFFLIRAYTILGECFNERPQKAKIFPHPGPSLCLSLLPYPISSILSIFSFTKILVALNQRPSEH
jgi:hypothetical protein